MVFKFLHGMNDLNRKSVAVSRTVLLVTSIVVLISCKDSYTPFFVTMMVMHCYWLGCVALRYRRFVTFGITEGLYVEVFSFGLLGSSIAEIFDESLGVTKFFRVGYVFDPSPALIAMCLLLMHFGPVVVRCFRFRGKEVGQLDSHELRGPEKVER